MLDGDPDGWSCPCVLSSIKKYHHHFHSDAESENDVEEESESDVEEESDTGAC